MTNKNKSFKKSQSILEYILVSFVFTTVGIGTFVAVNMGGFFAKHGTAANYHSKDTLIGQTLENGVDDSTQEWPQDWQDDAPEPEIAEWDGVEDDAEFLEGVEGYDGFSEYEH